MSRKDARKSSTKVSHWKTRLSLIAGIAAVIAVCAVARSFLGPDAASAQTPQRPQPRRQTTLPSARGTTAQQSQVRGPATRANAQQPVRQASSQTPATETRASNQIPAVVANVNSQQITRQQLADECVKRYGSDVVESIINKHVVWQACQANQIQITEAHVEAEIERMAGKFGLSSERWLQMLKEERDISPQEYRTEVIWLTLALKRLAREDIQVAPQEIAQALESEFGPRVSARIIVVETQQKADQIRSQAVAKPESFAQLAKQYSVDPSSSVQGVIPPIRKHTGDSSYAEFERTAFSLQPGQISPVVKLGEQFVIIKCEKLLEPSYLSAAVKQRAETQIRDRLEEQKLRASATATFGALKKNAKIVNVYNDAKLRQQMPGVAATINGHQLTISELADECIKRYGKSVLDGMINRTMLQQALKRKQRGVDQGDINAELARAADMYGYLTDGKPDIQKWITAITEQDQVSPKIYIEDAVWPSVALKKLVDAEVPVTEEDLQKGFESNFGVRTRVKAIVLGNLRQAQKVWAMARSNPTSDYFGQLASQYSIEPISKENLGQVPPVRRHGGQPLIEAEAAKLGPNNLLSSIVAVGDKHIFMFYMGRTDPQVKEMDESIRSELHKDIKEKKLRIAMGKEYDRLKQTASIHNFLTGTSQVAKQAAQQQLFPGGKQPGATGVRR